MIMWVYTKAEKTKTSDGCSPIYSSRSIILKIVVVYYVTTNITDKT